MKTNMNVYRIIGLLTAFTMFTVPSVGFTEEQITETGEAPCTIGDGYQTVKFDNGAVYSGYFSGCHPQAGKAKLELENGQVFEGYAKPIGNDQVTLNFDGGSVTITVITR